MFTRYKDYSFRSSGHYNANDYTVIFEEESIRKAIHR